MHDIRMPPPHGLIGSLRLNGEKIRGQANGETEFWFKLKGGTTGFYKELGGLLPLVCSALLRTARGGHTPKGEVAKTVTLTGEVYRISMRIEKCAVQLRTTAQFKSFLFGSLLKR